MKPIHFFTRILVLFLSLGIALPINPVFALRTIQSGQNPKIVKAITAGLEEDEEEPDFHWEIFGMQEEHFRAFMESLATEWNVSVSSLVKWLAHQESLDFGAGYHHSFIEWLGLNGGSRIFGLDELFPTGDPNLVTGRFENRWPFKESQFKVIYSFSSLNYELRMEFPLNESHEYYLRVILNMAHVLDEDGVAFLGIDVLENPELESALKFARLYVDSHLLKGQNILIVTKKPLAEVKASIIAQIQSATDLEKSSLPAGLEEAPYKNGRSMTASQVLKIVQRYSSDLLELNPNRIRSRKQRATLEGEDLYRAYEAVSVKHSISIFPTWPVVLRRAGFNPDIVYERVYDPLVLATRFLKGLAQENRTGLVVLSQIQARRIYRVSKKPISREILQKTNDLLADALLPDEPNRKEYPEVYSLWDSAAARTLRRQGVIGLFVMEQSLGSQGTSRLVHPAVTADHLLRRLAEDNNLAAGYIDLSYTRLQNTLPAGVRPMREFLGANPSWANELNRLIRLALQKNPPDRNEDLLAYLLWNGKPTRNLREKHLTEVGISSHASEYDHDKVAFDLLQWLAREFPYNQKLSLYLKGYRLDLPYTFVETLGLSYPTAPAFRYGHSLAPDVNKAIREFFKEKETPDSAVKKLRSYGIHLVRVVPQGPSHRSLDLTPERLAERILIVLPTAIRDNPSLRDGNAITLTPWRVGLLLGSETVHDYLSYLRPRLKSETNKALGRRMKNSTLNPPLGPRDNPKVYEAVQFLKDQEIGVVKIARGKSTLPAAGLEEVLITTLPFPQIDSQDLIAAPLSYRGVVLKQFLQLQGTVEASWFVFSAIYVLWENLTDHAAREALASARITLALVEEQAPDGSSQRFIQINAQDDSPRSWAIPIHEAVTQMGRTRKKLENKQNSGGMGLPALLSDVTDLKGSLTVEATDVDRQRRRLLYRDFENPETLPPIQRQGTLITVKVPLRKTNMSLEQLAQIVRPFIFFPAGLEEFSTKREIAMFITMAESSGLEEGQVVVLDVTELEKFPWFVSLMRQMDLFATHLILLGQSEVARQLTLQKPSIQWVGERSPDAVISALRKVPNLAHIAFLGGLEESYPVQVVGNTLKIPFSRQPLTMESILKSFGVSPELAAQIATGLEEVLGLGHEA